MAHLQQDTFNALLEGDVTSAERRDYIDHILACSTCSVRYRALRDLKETMQPKPKMIPLRYLIGVAAVMTMAVWPYFSSQRQLETPKPFQSSTQAVSLNTEHFDLLERVQAVNLQSAAEKWSRGQSTVSDLIALTNKN